LIALPALTSLLITYVGLVNQSERLVFGESQFERRGLPHPAINRDPVSYSQVERVRAAGLGLLIVEVAGGKTLRFLPDGYEGGTRRLLSELRGRIPADRFQVDLEAALKSKSRKDRLAPAISFTALALVVLGGWSDQLIDLVRRKHAWTLEFDADSIKEDVEDFQLGQDGVVWLYVRRRGELADLASYAVRRVCPTGEQTWWLPAEDELFPQGAPEFLNPFLGSLSLSDSGEPVLFIGRDLPLLRLSAGKWVWDTVVGAERPDRFAELAAVTGDPYWTSLRSRPVVLARESVGSPLEELRLGAEGTDFLLDFRVDYLGRVIARIMTSSGRAFFLIVLGDEFPHDWIEIDLSGVTLLEPWEMIDYATDTTGALVVLVRDRTYCGSQEPTSHLGRLDAGTGSWRWVTVHQPGPCDALFGEPRLIIDGHDRIWLPASRLVSVFPAETLLGAEPAGIIHYTRYNSGLAGGSRLQIDSQGRLWATDRLGDGVAWIDPTMRELPRPLPAWIAAWRENLWWQTALMIAGTILLVGGFAWIRRYAPKSRP